MSKRTDACVDRRGTSFGERHFGQAKLGHKRRTARLVRVADRIVRHPCGTLPEKMKEPKELEALYHLMNAPDVTHANVLAQHLARTRRLMTETEGYVVCAHDSTELDYSNHKSLEGIGRIGNGTTKGWLCHNSLAIDPRRGGVLGLANQILHTRAEVDKQETTTQSREREDRESRLWIEGAKSLPALAKIVDVCDRGADTFEFLSHAMDSGRTFVIRSSRDRKTRAGHEGTVEHGHLHQLAKGCPSLGSWTLKVDAATIKKTVRKTIGTRRTGRTTTVARRQRDAVLRVAASPVRVLPPTRERGVYAKRSLPLWVVRVWEPNPPKGVEPLEWFLLTNHPVSTFDDARTIVSWYECRWIVEEYHKAMKTGCGIENPQFTRVKSLHAMIALLSVVATTLLNLRETARGPDAKTRKATEIVPRAHVKLLSAWRLDGKSNLDWSVHDYYMAMARLGGHRNRKSDGDPGWLVLWRGWTTLQTMLDGVSALEKIA